MIKKTDLSKREGRGDVSVASFGGGGGHRVHLCKGAFFSKKNQQLHRLGMRAVRKGSAYAEGSLPTGKGGRIGGGGGGEREDQLLKTCTPT